jgi:hypothetical protein
MSMKEIAVADGTQLQLGRGALFLARLNPTTLANEGFLDVGNCTLLEVSTSVEQTEKRSSVDDTNELLARVETSRTMEVNITLGEYRKDNLALALVGDTGNYTQGATPVVGETLTADSKQGRTYFAANRKLTSVAVKVSAATKVEGTDYEIDTETGAVKIIVGGSIADASTVTIDYTPTAITTLDTVSLGTAGTIYCALNFVGKPLNGKVQELYLPKVQISPDGALGFITEDFADYNLKGTIVKDTADVNFPLGKLIIRP